MANLNLKVQKQTTYDAIVIGSGASFFNGFQPKYFSACLCPQLCSVEIHIS